MDVPCVQRRAEKGGEAHAAQGARGAFSIGAGPIEVASEADRGVDEPARAAIYTALGIEPGPLGERDAMFVSKRRGDLLLEPRRHAH